MDTRLPERLRFELLDVGGGRCARRDPEDRKKKTERKITK
jgi:hypothetical protein